jgi:hypothetical protein
LGHGRFPSAQGPGPPRPTTRTRQFGRNGGCPLHNERSGYAVRCSCREIRSPVSSQHGGRWCAGRASPACCSFPPCRTCQETGRRAHCTEISAYAESMPAKIMSPLRTVESITATVVHLPAGNWAPPSGCTSVYVCDGVTLRIVRTCRQGQQGVLFAMHMICNGRACTRLRNRRMWQSG